MGREIKRVALDFDWPLDNIWEGFVRPDFGIQPCLDCRYGDDFSSGYSPEANAIAGTFYSHMISWQDRAHADRLSWADKIGQAEVDHLIAEGRLRTWVPPKDGEERGHYESLPRTAAEVNEAQRRGGMGGHDAINWGILVRFRCERLGITVECATCSGMGDLATPEQREASEKWTGSEPPPGEGWQVWETVSEGSPITPVFPTPEALIDYLSTLGTVWDQKPTGDGPWRRSAAESFVRSGWAPSLVTRGNEVLVGGRDDDRMHDS